MIKIRSTGVDTFDSDFFSKNIEFDYRNGKCVPLTYYAGAKNSKNEEFFNTKLCYDLEKYLSINEERKKCLIEYGPALMKILEENKKDVNFTEMKMNKDSQISRLVFAELGNCKTYKTSPLAQDFSLWEPAIVPSVVVTPIATEKD